MSSVVFCSGLHGELSQWCGELSAVAVHPAGWWQAEVEEKKQCRSCTGREESGHQL